MKKIRVICVDDSALVRGLMTEIINKQPDMEVVAVAPDPLVARELIKAGEIKSNPIHGGIAAVSVGVYRGVPVLDLDYAEDSDCDTDMNVVMNDGGGFIELQGTAEGHAFRREELAAMTALAETGIAQLVAKQREAL